MLTDAEKDAIRHHYQAIGKSLPGFRPRDEGPEAPHRKRRAVREREPRTIDRPDTDEGPLVAEPRDDLPGVLARAVEGGGDIARGGRFG